MKGIEWYLTDKNMIFTPIEWTLIFLVFISFYYLMEKRASNPKIRLRGVILNLIAGILQMLFLISISVWSMVILSIVFVPMKVFGIKNCIIEIKKGRK